MHDTDQIFHLFLRRLLSFLPFNKRLDGFANDLGCRNTLAAGRFVQYALRDPNRDGA